MAEFSKYSDGNIVFDERELSAISKLLNNKQLIIEHITDECQNPQDIQDFVSAVVKITKAEAIWEEKKREEVEENE